MVPARTEASNKLFQLRKGNGNKNQLVKNQRFRKMKRQPSAVNLLSSIKEDWAKEREKMMTMTIFLSCRRVAYNEKSYRPAVVLYINYIASLFRTMSQSMDYTSPLFSYGVLNLLKRTPRMKCCC